MVARGLKKQAILSNGRSRMCVHCKFLLSGRQDVCDLCSNAFIEGFMKGAKWQKKMTRKDEAI